MRNDLTPLKDTGLPGHIAAMLERMGYKALTPPQVDAVRAGVAEGADVVVAAPTASGKTLIGYIAMLKAVSEGGKAVYATPLKALAEEKFEDLKQWGDRLGFRVGITTGDYDSPGEWLRSYDVIVATYERLDSLFRLRPSWLSSVSTLVVDEFHMIGDQKRGPVVELVTVRAKDYGMQVVGLSATIGNPEELAEWLGAEAVVSGWRPVDLVEGWYRRRAPGRGEIIFTTGHREPVKGDLYAFTAHKARAEGWQALAFIHSRSRVESTAVRVAKTMPQVWGRAAEFLEEHGATKTEVKSLAPLMERGVAYHHAGLSQGARKAVEEAFREGRIYFVVATPTLAAGVNMPARRVLVSVRRYSAGYGMVYISVAEYKQMAGRAGRPQYDPIGEAVIVDARGEDSAHTYIYGYPEPVTSSLTSRRNLRIHVLATVASGYAKDTTELYRFFSRTFAAHKVGDALEDHVKWTIDWLIEEGFMNVRGRALEPTPLGSAVARLYIDPFTAFALRDLLKDAPFPAGDLYYLHAAAMTPDFSDVRVIKYSALEEDAFAALDSGAIPDQPDWLSFNEWLRAYKLALILKSWIEEAPIDEIVTRYGIGAGDLRVYVDTASWIVTAMSKIIRYLNPESVRKHGTPLAKLAMRIEHGVKEELLDLVRIRYVGRVRARALYRAGFRNVADVASADPGTIARIAGIGPKLASEIVASAKEILTQGGGA